ncbi:MAG TPA: dihydrofolate reductase family protein [Streptosporangiaceae bacterium]|nr:dihydrofolate reductase family protein [Streptosporangiaceae bacterium]
MRLIYPGPGRQLDSDTDQLVAELAALYAYPDDGRWLRANMVASVDGSVTSGGRSGGLSGAADRLVFVVLRSLADVVLVGAGTARQERYRRVPPAETWPALRAGRPATPPIAVVTRRLDLTGRLVSGRNEDGGSDGAPARTIVLTTEQAPREVRAAAARTADVVVAGESEVTATAAVEALTGLGYRKILTEGGPNLLSQLADAGLLDELCLTISPVLEGGHGRKMTAAPQPTSPAPLTLASVLEDDGFLLTRYVRAQDQARLP